MTLYDVKTRKSLVRLKTEELAWRELCEEFFRNDQMQMWATLSPYARRS